MGLTFAGRSNRWLLGLVIAATAFTGGTVFYGLSRFGLSQEPIAQPTQSAPSKITALGRLEPRSEVIKLSAPLTLDGDRVAELFVKQGDRVKAGQVIAILDSRARLQATLEEAKERVRVAQSRLAQVQAGAQVGEITAQKANIARLEAQLRTETMERQAEIARVEAELRNAASTYQRYQSLYQEGAERAVIADEKRERYETTLAQLNRARAQQDTTISTLRQQIQQEQATLDRIAEVRPVDLRTAGAEVNAAIAGVKRAETDLEQVYIRAPIAGQVLKVHTRAGEKLSENGIVELGQTDDMVVVAEIYQTDIDKVKLGQPATIISQGFVGELQGSVYEVGLQVSRQNVFSAQPGENLDRRVVEVKIRLGPEASRRIASLTNLQVQVGIQI